VLLQIRSTKLNELLDHYAASFESLTGDLEPIQEKLEELIRKDDALKSIGMKNSHELGCKS
jgi:uncharacterized protein YoxC